MAARKNWLTIVENLISMQSKSSELLLFTLLALFVMCLSFHNTPA